MAAIGMVALGVVLSMMAVGDFNEDTASTGGSSSGTVVGGVGLGDSTVTGLSFRTTGRKRGKISIEFDVFKCFI